MFFGHSSSLMSPPAIAQARFGHWATSVSHNISDPSPLPEATAPPSGLKATLYTLSR